MLTELALTEEQELTTYIHNLAIHKDLDPEAFELNKKLGTTFSRKAQACAKGYAYIDLNKISQVFKAEAKPYIDFKRNFKDSKYIRSVDNRGNVQFFTDIPSDSLDLEDGYLATGKHALTDRKALTITTREGKMIPAYRDKDGYLVPYENSVHDASFAAYTMPRENVVQEVGITEQPLQSFDDLIPTEQAEKIILAQEEFDDIRIWDAYKGPEIDLNPVLTQVQAIHERNYKETRKVTRRARAAMLRTYDATEDTRSRVKQGFADFKESSFSLADPLAVGVKHIEGTSHYYFITGWK